MLIANPHALTEPNAELRSKTAVFFRSLAAMGYVALNVGSHELAVGIKILRKNARSHRLTLLSANIVDSASDKPAFTETMIRRVGGLKIGLFGLVSQNPPGHARLFISKGLKVLAPVKAAREAVQHLRAEGCDLVIALSQLTRQEIGDVGEKVEGLNLILGSSGMELTPSLQRVGQSLYGDAYMKGKHVGQLLFRPGSTPGKWTGANLQQSMGAERAALAQQVQSINNQLQSASAPGSMPHLTDESRKHMQSRLASVRARMQRITMDMEGFGPPSADAGIIELSLPALGKDIADQAKVLRIVDAHKRKYPSKAPAGHNH